MTGQPTLSDRAALLRNRARARAHGPALFLHAEAAAEIEERLNEVNRRFTAPAIVTGFPEPWADLLPAATIVPDDETLTLSPGAHDLVIHAMAMHWANDPVGQLVQCRRALKPDGLFLGVMFGGRTLAELRAVLAETEARMSGGLSPRVLPMAEIRDLGGLLQRAGFALPVADAASKTVTYATLFHLIADLRAMGEANALTRRNRQPVPRDFFPQAARHYADNYPTEGRRIRATFELIFLTGWAPDDSQPKPLRPGSAVQRLADALGTDENGLPRDDGGNAGGPDANGGGNAIGATSATERHD